MSDFVLAAQVERTKNGDAASFDRLVARFQNFAVGYAYTLTGDWATAEDVAQEAFVAAWQQIGSLRESVAFGGWLRQIVFKQADRVRRVRRPVVPLETAHQMASLGEDLEEQAFRAERVSNLEKALGSLTEGERTVLVLFYLRETGQSEIATFLGVSVAAVKKRLERARTRLKGLVSMSELEEMAGRAPSENPRFAEVNRLLRDLTTQLQNDPQIVAAYLARWGNDEGLGAQNDAWASLNLHVVVGDTYLPYVAGGRLEYASRVREPLLWVEAPQNAPEEAYYLMAWYDGEAGPYEVDWYFHPLTVTGALPEQSVVLVNKRTLAETGASLAGGFNGTEPVYNPKVPELLQAQWDAQSAEEKAREAQRNRLHLFWAMWLISAKYVARNPNEERMGFVGMLRDLTRDVRQEGEKSQVENTGSGEEAPQPTPQEKVALLRRLAADMEALQNAVAEQGVTLPVKAVARAHRFLERIEAASLT